MCCCLIARMLAPLSIGDIYLSCVEVGACCPCLRGLTTILAYSAITVELFNHNLAKMVQRHIIDQQGELTPPWEEHDKLRTGTVVLMRISLRTYSINQTYSQKKVCVFQFTL